MSAAPNDYYKVLGIAPDATPDDIRAAYKELARKWHPDRNPGDKHAEEQIKQINEAYAVLRDPMRRRLHDLLLAQGADVRAAGRASERMAHAEANARGAGNPFGFGFDPTAGRAATWRAPDIRLFFWEIWLVRALLASLTWFFTRFRNQLLNGQYWRALFIILTVLFFLTWPTSLVVALLLLLAGAALPAALLFYILARIRFSRAR